MTKYILSSGASVITEIPTTPDGVLHYSISKDVEKAVRFDTIGEAMVAASKVNEFLGSACYRAVQIEV